MLTAPTYPRINPTKQTMVLTSEATGFFCSDTFEATLALRAINDAFAAGQRSMIEAHGDRLERAIEALKPAVERKDDGR